ncbi:type VII secretion integral membrane protein EccD [Streptomyces dangxiongensis]|uniref:Type VII secretion integral membrane protein EccD n=1 Tax=Streptomyces dangxiongensis TaxID=1442032 RepID=A0A3G2JQG1_9ACTN|nr:type VII secretion integral membrane protein EccD [Streptomyces dangxiongensis]AYN43209.1 type VII secretion integral membrane protein EccD [Streptomyces dangxiongensis]
MSLSSIMPDLDGTAVCRITVVGPERRADLGVPTALTLGTLLPVLAARLAPDGAPAGGYVLQRLGEEPLDPDDTPESAGLRDGDLLHLRPVEEVLPPLVFDDIADGVATVVGSRSDRWRPELTRRLFLALACLALAALALFTLAVEPDGAAAAQSGVVAVALLTGCLLAVRADADAATVLVTGVAGWAFAAAAGLIPWRGATALLAPTGHELLVGATCAAVAATVLLLSGKVPVQVFGALLTVAVTAEAGSLLSLDLGWSATTACSVVAVTMFVLSTVAPRLFLRLAGLRVPQLPRNADELQEDIEPATEPAVARRVAAADAHLTLFTVGASVVYALDLVLLTRRSGWSDWLLALTLAAAVTLRSRSVTEIWQRVSLALAGTLGLILAVAWLLVPGGPQARAALAVLLLAAVAALLAARRLRTLRLLPIWGHVADILETVTAIALIPLLLQVLHVYWYFRTLAG